MAEEFNLEESSAYFASDQIKDFVKKQSQFDKLMMSKSALPIAAFDFIVGFSIFLAIQAAVHHGSYQTALFFAAIFCSTAYSLGLFSIRYRFDRWQSLLLSLKSWVLAYAFTLGIAPLWLSDGITPHLTSTTLASLAAGIVMYLAHWYLARGLRNHAFHFVIMGEPTAITVSLLKEVRRPREVVSYRHIHKLYHLISSQRVIDPSQVIQTLNENNISTIVLTTNHAPSTNEELLLIEARKCGIDCISEEDLWEDVTKCAAISSSKRDDFLKALQVDGRPTQNMIRRALESIIAAVALVALFPLFVILYIIASMRIGQHAIAKQSFVGLNQTLFNGRVLIFTAQNTSTQKELKVGQHAQNSFFEKWCWKSGIWKYPLFIEVIMGRLHLVGSPLRSADSNSATESSDSEISLSTVLDKTMRPGIISHFELVEQEPTYFESQQRQPLSYTLYYRKHRSLLLDGYLLALCLVNKVFGRSPQRAWLS
jgi:lipopolysaccharide/colanic/teichoic acid biosynthesis glycosyltransferase